MGKYSICTVSSHDIVEFWKNSPHATIFTHPEILNKLSKRIDWWMALKGNEPMCVWPVCMPDGINIGLPSFTYYVGPMWSKVACMMPNSSWLTRSTDIYYGFIEQFLINYDQIKACLPVGVIDIRAFDWWNYHAKRQPRFTIKPKYTACINRLKQMDNNDIVSGFRELRRRELRRIQNNNYLPGLTDEWTANDIIRLYVEVMTRQAIQVDAVTKHQISCLVDLVNLGYGEVVAFKDSSQDQVIAATLLLYGNGTANMVLNVVDSTWRNSGLPAWQVYNSIIIAREKGAKEFDFNGANSPNRGDDKHSYGSSAVLYFEIEYPGYMNKF